MDDTPTPKLSTMEACRVVGFDRAWFNESVIAEHYTCAPQTVQGRSRFFDPDDMVGLWVFRELIDDRVAREIAGFIACEVSQCARENPKAECVSFVEGYFSFRSGRAVTFEEVPHPSTWHDSNFFDMDIRKVTNFNIAKMRKLIAQYTSRFANGERSIIGPDD